MIWFKSPEIGLYGVKIDNKGIINLQIKPESKLVTRMRDILWAVMYSSDISKNA